MKKLFLTFSAVLLCAGILSATTDKADELFSKMQFAECKAELLGSLKGESSPAARAEILWRLARVEVVLGEKAQTKADKRAIFGSGMKYGEQAMALAPRNKHGYMWHSANVGRECQTHSLFDQAAAVPVMMKDLEMILNTLGAADYSEAWQALGEIFYNHPMKSNDDALNFARRAVMTIPTGEKRIETYKFFITVLRKRDYSAEKRRSVIAENALDAAKADNNIAKYAEYDGLLSASHTPKWSGKPLGQMSDSEEASAVEAYIRNL